MRSSFKKGLGFGLTSGIITTLGVIVGLNSSTGSLLAIIGGICTIAVADSLSDAMGMHISEESNKNNSEKKIWESTFATFLSKFIFAISFIMPFLIFGVNTAIAISVVWGFLLISIFSYVIAKNRGEKPFRVIFEHATIAAAVIIFTHYVGLGVHRIFIQ